MTADSSAALGASWQTPGAGYTDEQAQDAVGGILTDTASIDFTYSDAGNTISAAVLPGGVDHNSLANLTTGDVHTQYFLSIGRSGGQFLIGGSASGNNLLIRSTSNATKGLIAIADTGGNITIGGAATASELRFLEPSGSGTNYTAFKAVAQAGDVTYSLPIADAAVSGYVLSSNASGALSWVTNTTAPGGLNTYIQFNDSGVFGGDVDFTYNKAANQVIITTGGIVIDGEDDEGYLTLGSGTVAHIYYHAITNGYGAIIHNFNLEISNLEFGGSVGFTDCLASIAAVYSTGDPTITIGAGLGGHGCGIFGYFDNQNSMAVRNSGLGSCIFSNVSAVGSPLTLENKGAGSMIFGTFLTDSEEGLYQIGTNAAASGCFLLGHYEAVEDQEENTNGGFANVEGNGNMIMGAVLTSENGLKIVNGSGLSQGNLLGGVATQNSAGIIISNGNGCFAWGVDGVGDAITITDGIGCFAFGYTDGNSIQVTGTKNCFQWGPGQNATDTSFKIFDSFHLSNSGLSLFGVPYTWPGSNSAGNLANDGSGGLTWNSIIPAAGAANATVTGGGGCSPLVVSTTAGSYEIGAYLRISAFTVGTVGLNASYNDDAGTSRNLAIPMTTLAGAVVATAGAVGVFSAVSTCIQTDGSTSIVLGVPASVFTGTYKVYFWIKRIG